jgi:hypothetical protein
MSRHKGYREGDGEQYDCGSITPPLVMVMHETDKGVYRGCAEAMCNATQKR